MAIQRRNENDSKETRKILGLSDDVAITATCVRVPVYNSHSVEINVTFEKRYNS